MAVTTTTTTHFAKRIGTAVKDKIGRTETAQGPWYNTFMAAASRAITERLPLVDIIVEVRDARIPLSSECKLLRNYAAPFKRIVALNKMDLAGRSGLLAWVEYFRTRNCIPCGVNAHNKESIKEFLSLIQCRVRELRTTDHADYTATVMLIGIPNVGKSALANALHQVGRISAAEKGKLKHATVSPEPGETKDIRSFKEQLAIVWPGEKKLLNISCLFSTLAGNTRNGLIYQLRTMTESSIPAKQGV